MSEATRGYIYRIALVVAVLLVTYGFLSDAESQVWLQLVGAVLAIGPATLATKNTSTS